MAVVSDRDGRPARGLKRKFGCVDPILQLGRPNLLEARYIIDHQLGKGAFGSVHVAKRTRGGEFHVYACKSVLKEKTNARVHEEVEIMQHLSGHGGVVNLKEVLEAKDMYHLVMEMCEGGSLWDLMKKAGSARCTSEKDAATLMKDLILITKYLHEMGVAHRDIKPQNILFTKSGQMKLADFGLAARIGEGRSLSGDVGTAGYMAPETLKEEGNYDQKVDVWSAGILLHLILLGRHPFEGTSDAILEVIRASDELDFNTKEWSSVSYAARDLLSKMLRRDASSRISIDAILRHPWMVLNTRNIGPAVSANPVGSDEMDELAPPTKRYESDWYGKKKSEMVIGVPELEIGLLL
ncbi:hypothetical protein LUZ60_001841 [Juncus effusus]|nr:hypothetical protein LUZ60_001841 [Juncus effusus]